MTWFRLYTELLHDHKVQTLKPELFKAWINALCLAAANKRRGYLPPTKDIAYALRCSEKKAAILIDGLFAAGLLDADPADGTPRPHNWDQRQYEGDERPGRFRRRKKVNAAPDVPVTVTRQTYSEFLGSEYWLARRLLALELGGGCCAVCKADAGLDVHHNTYERLGQEWDSDLIVLCRDCHTLFHENGKLARPID